MLLRRTQIVVRRTPLPRPMPIAKVIPRDDAIRVPRDGHALRPQAGLLTPWFTSRLNLRVPVPSQLVASRLAPLFRP